MEEITCKICGKLIRKYPYQIHKKYCSNTCKLADPDFHEARARAMWRGTYKQIKRIALKNYLQSGRNLVCNMCGGTDRMCIHHIDNNRLNNDANNLEALCNSCHSKLHLHRRRTCPVCHQILIAGHRCPSEYKRHRWGQKSIANRNRCKKCGRVLGINEKHVCGKHPKGFLGYHHTEYAKKSISRKISKIKKKWWKHNVDWKPSAALIRRRRKLVKKWWTKQKRKERSESMKMRYKDSKLYEFNRRKANGRITIL